MTLSPRTVMRRYLLIFGGAFLLLSGFHAIRLWRQPTDIWWTPPGLAVPIAESGDRVRIYLRGELLDEVFSRARLQIATDSGVASIGAADVNGSHARSVPGGQGQSGQ